MISKTKLTELASAAHATAVANGFYENPVELGTKLMLVITEMAERDDAVILGINIEKRMKRRYVDAIHSIKRYYEQFKAGDIDARVYSSFYQANVKDTIEAEFAGTIIRMLDLIGSYKYTFQRDIVYAHDIGQSGHEFPVVLDLARFLEQVRSGIEPNMWLLENGVNKLYQYGNSWVYNLSGIDSDELMLLFIEAEMAYNSTRKKLHGKKF